MSKWPTKILFKYPSRGRRERFLKGMENILLHIKDENNFQILVTADEDDPQMEELPDFKNTLVIYGKSDSKIHAINRDMELADPDWDIVVCMSDDMEFNLYGFDDCIRIDMNEHFPDMDGLLHYPDQDAKEWLATMYIAGRKFYDRFGYIYHPSYKSLWCDNEIQDVAKRLGKYRYCGYQINLHHNPAYGHLPKDEMFLQQQGFWVEDETNYHKRKANNFDL